MKTEQSVAGRRTIQPPAGKKKIGSGGHDGDELQYWHKYPDVAGEVTFLLFLVRLRGNFGYGRRNGWIFKHVNAELGCSEFAFNRTLDELEEHGLISKIERHKYTLYAITEKEFKRIEDQMNRLGIAIKDIPSWQRYGPSLQENEGNQTSKGAGEVTLHPPLPSAVVRRQDHA